MGGSILILRIVISIKNKFAGVKQMTTYTHHLMNFERKIRDVIDADKHLSAEAKGDILICLEEELRKKHFNYQPELGV